METYNTGKVKIGSTYQRPLPTLTRDEELVQSALLGTGNEIFDKTGKLLAIIGGVATFVAIVLLMGLLDEPVRDHGTGQCGSCRVSSK